MEAVTTVIKCDRCKKVLSDRGSHIIGSTEDNAPLSLISSQLNPKDLGLSALVNAVDLCGECRASFNIWWKN